MRGLKLCAIVAIALFLTGCQPGGQASTSPSPPSTTAEPSSTTSGPSSTTSEAPSTTGEELPTVGDGEEWIVFQGVPLGLSFTRPDGTGNHVILGPPGGQVHPDWSPDGAEIAYTQSTDQSSDIWITDPQGTNPRQLLVELPSELGGLFWDNPAWSPDGSQIAMVGYEENAQTGLPPRSILVTVAVDSAEVTVVSELASADGFLHAFPRWSPAGDAMVISLDQFEGEEYLGGSIAIIRRTGTGWSEPESITEVVGSPRVDWHPADDLIVYATNDVGAFPFTDDPSNLFTIRPDGTELTQITNFGGGEDRASQPTWTRDGRIIFTHITGANDEQLTVAFIEADGSGLEIAVGTDLVGAGNRPHPRLRPVA